MKTLLSGHSIILKVHVIHAGVTKSLPLDISSPIFAVCEHIRSVIREAEPEPNKKAKDYGLFLPHEMSRNGLWLDNTKNLAQYILKHGDIIEYRYKFRPLSIKTQDDIKKTLLVDDSWTVAELMMAICAKMGILNHEEYSLVKPTRKADQNQPTTSTKAFLSDSKVEKMEKMKKALHTDDDMEWLNPSQTLRQQGIDEQEVLLLQRKYFFSDMNIDTRDPIQLGLLFIQLKESILSGKHPVSQDEAENFAAFQCQIEFGDINVQKSKLPMKVKDCVPKDYVKSKGIEKRILKIYSTLRGKDSVEAKREYCALCRSLKTYGITFFLVKEKVKEKNKLIPRLLGISKDRVVRLDEKTKEILKTWPLTSIKRWAGSYNAFTMDFGDYAPNEYYTAQTTKGEQISQLIAGYIDIIIKYQKAEEPRSIEGGEESFLAEIKIEPNKAEIVEHRCSITPKSFEEITREREVQITLTSPCEEVAQITSVSDMSPMDFTNITSFGQSDQDDFTNAEMLNRNSAKPNNYNSHRNGNYENTVKLENQFGEGRNSKHREINSAMSFGTTKIVQHYNSQSRNTLVSREALRSLNYSPDSFMTGGTQICHTVRRLTVAQRSLLNNINKNLQKLQETKLMLGEKLDTDEREKIFHQQSKENVKALSKEHAIQNLGSMNTEVVQVLRSSKHAPLNSLIIDDEQIDGNQHLKDIEKSFRVITVHFPSFIDNVRTIAEINHSSTADEITEIKTLTTDAEDDTYKDASENIVDAARKLADAFSGMLNAVKPQEEESDLDFRKAILDAANRVGEASSQLFRQITSPERSVTAISDNRSILGRLLQNSDNDYEDTLIFLVRTVANATAHLVQTVKSLTQSENATDTIIGCQRLISPVTHAGLATSQLVTCVKILAPTVNQASCTNQILAEIEEVRESIDNVGAVALELQENPSNYNSNTMRNILAQSGLEEAMMDVRQALSHLEQHLQCGISVVNFAPRIQSLEMFLIQYFKIKRSLINFSGNLKKTAKQSEDLLELLLGFVQISDNIAEEIRSLSDNEHREDDPVIEAKNIFITNKTILEKLIEKLPHENTELWKDIHYAIDNAVFTVLYEPGTRFIAHDQLIHNLYRSTQILLTTCHKLVSSYQEVVDRNTVVSEFQEVINRSEYLLLLMNEIKYDPSNEINLVLFMRESEKLTQSCSNFCSSLDSMIPSTREEILIDILVSATSQALAQCEHMESMLECIQPLRPHLELSVASKLLADNRLEHLYKIFPHQISLKMNLSQFIQISLAILERIKVNIQQTAPRAHYSAIFELFGIENSEPSLLINLYHYLVKMNEIIDAESLTDMKLKLKNVTVVLCRLIMHSDKMLISYGINSINEYPIMKCVDEIISTLSSLQPKHANIFEDFKADILHKENAFKSRSLSSINKGIINLKQVEFSIQHSNLFIKRFVENVLNCKQYFNEPSLTDYVESLQQSFNDIFLSCDALFNVSRETRIADDFITLSLSLLNFIEELESKANEKNEIQSKELRIHEKSRVIYDYVFKLQNSLELALKLYFGTYSEAILRLEEIQHHIENKTSDIKILWDLKCFTKVISDIEMIKTNCDILRETFDERKPIAFDNQLLYIAESICDVCLTILEKYSDFPEKRQLLLRLLDLGLSLIYTSLNLLKNPDQILEIQNLHFTIKDIIDTSVYVANCVRELIPGYKECSAALATVAQLSHDVNEIEVSLASESDQPHNDTKLKPEDTKKCAFFLYEMAITLLRVHQSVTSVSVPDEHLPIYVDDFMKNFTTLIDILVNFAKTDPTSAEAMSLIKESNDLLDAVDKYLQSIKSFFDNVETENSIHNTSIIRNLVIEIVMFLKIFDVALANGLISMLNSSVNDLAIFNTDKTQLANTMSGIITDEDTTILFASAGIRNSDFDGSHNALKGRLTVNGEQSTIIPYHPQAPVTTSNSFRRLINQTTEALLLDTESLVQNGGISQKCLAENTKTIVKTIFDFADEYKDQIIEDPNKLHETSIFDVLSNVKAVLHNVYDDKSTEVSRLTLSNAESLMQDNSKKIEKINTFSNPLDKTCSEINHRLDSFLTTVAQNTERNQEGQTAHSSSQVDLIMEKLVTHASSIVALSSELMRMPIQTLFQSQEQRQNISTNISSQCKLTLFDYLDSLEELSAVTTKSRIHKRIKELGSHVTKEFLKFFDLLEKIGHDPDDKFIKSYMLDVFYEIQDSIKSFLDFSAELHASEEQQKNTNRRVSFREHPSPLKQKHISDNSSAFHDPLFSIKRKVVELNDILSDLNHKGDSHLPKGEINWRVYVELFTQFAQLCTDMIGLSRECLNGLINLGIPTADIASSINDDVTSDIDQAVRIIRSCIYGANVDAFSKLCTLNDILRQITERSSEVLSFYQQYQLNLSWFQLLQAVVKDLESCSKEIMNVSSVPFFQS